MGHDATAPRIAVILVVDQVGSTNFLVTYGEAEADRVTTEHGDAVHRIVDALGGRVEGSTGDGYVASFGLGSAALDAAVEIQRAASRLSEHYPAPVELRVGLAIGEVHHDGVELRGWPFFVATRLCDAADDGTILASTTLLDVVATRSTHALGTRHTLNLKGLGEPVDAVEIEWRPTADHQDVGLDPDLAVLDQRAWVGRSDVVRQVVDAITSDGPSPLVVVVGEPGAGKSRLIARVAAEATADRHLVLYGAAPRDPRSSYGPVITALRSALLGLPAELRSSVLVGAAGRELTRLLPDLGGPGREILRVAEGPGASRLLLEAIGEVLARLAEHTNGVTFVIDDVQWADDETMATIRHLTGPAGPSNVGVVAVVRAADADRLNEFMADVARRGDLVRIDLPGLSADDIAELVSDGQPSLRSDDLARTADYLATRTGGNALFVTSLVQHPDWLDAVLTSGSDPELPAELSVAIAERLGSLDDADVAALTSASVIGQRFPARLLIDVAGITPDGLAATIGRARQAGLLHDLGGGDVGFVHDLVRRALLPPRDSFERAVIHRAIAERFENEPEPDVAATASHYVAGVAGGADPTRAVEWSERAARLAMRQLSYAEAARRYGDALGLVPEDDARRHRLRVDLGRAQLYAGDPTHRQTLLDAVDVGLEADMPDVAAEAALTNNRGLYSVAGEVDHERVHALERVLAAAEHDPAVRSELTATLAVESVFTGASAEQLDALSQEAVDLARESGDDEALAHALTKRQDANYRLDNLPERLDETEELLALADDLDLRTRFWAVAHRAVAVGEAGRWDEVAAMVTEAEALANATRSPALEWYAAVLTGALAIQKDELREAQTVIDRGYELGLETGQPDALVSTAGQQCEVLRRRGRYETIHALAAENLDEELLRASTPMRALLLLEQGRENDAQQLWESVGLDGALDVPAAQVGHNLLHARELCRTFGDDEALEVIDLRLAEAPPYLFCNYWEPTSPVG